MADNLQAARDLGSAGKIGRSPEDADAARPVLRRLDISEVLLVFAPVAAGLFYVIAHSGKIQYTGDSAGYMFFHPSRPVGYPIILYILRAITPDYGSVPYFQAASLGLSIGLIALALARTSSRTWLAVAFIVVEISNSAYWAYTLQIMSEAVSATILNLFIATAIANVKDRRSWCNLAYALLTITAITIRPANVVVGLASAFAAWQFSRTPAWRNSVLPSTCMVMAIFVGYEISPVTQLLVTGRATVASPLARGLLQKTLFFEQGPVPALGVSAEDRQIIAQARKPALAYLAQAPDRFRPKLERAYADYLRFRVILPTLVRLHGAQDDWEIDPLLAKYALAQIKAFPLQYTLAVFREDLRLLSFQGWNDRRTQEDFSKFVASHPMPLPAAVPDTPQGVELDRKARTALHLPPDDVRPSTAGIIFPRAHVIPVPLIIALRLGHSIAALIGLLAIMATVWPRFISKMRRGYYLRAAAVLGFLLLGETLLTSISEFGLLRYIAPLWSVAPAIYALSLLAVDWLPDRRGCEDLDLSARRPLRRALRGAEGRRQEADQPSNDVAGVRSLLHAPSVYGQSTTGAIVDCQSDGEP